MLKRLQILNQAEIEQVQDLLPTLTFGDPGNLHPGQSSTEAIRDENALIVARLIVEALQKHESYKCLLGKTVENWLISKTEVGQQFKVHQDNPAMGEFSVTVFLNDDFEGGHLCLKPNSAIDEYLPEAGSAIVYDVGIPHKVAPVTSGTRYAMVFWIRSYCQDPAMREVLGNLLQAYMILREENPKTHWDTFYLAENDPQFWLTKGINRLIQQYAPGYN